MENNLSVSEMLFPVVKAVTDSMTDHELNALFLSAGLKTDPRKAKWYKKAEPLFTQEGGKEVHESVLPALQYIWKTRVGNMYDETLN